MSNPFLTKHSVTPEDIAAENKKFDHSERSYDYNGTRDKKIIEDADKKHYSLDEYQHRRRTFPKPHPTEMGKPYGEGHNMELHGEGKKHGEK